MRLKTLTLGELQELVNELVEEHGEDTRVLFTADYGDYHHTPQALPLTGEVDEREVVESAYSNSGFALLDRDEDLDDESDDPDAEAFLVLR